MTRELVLLDRSGDDLRIIPDTLTGIYLMAHEGENVVHLSLKIEQARELRDYLNEYLEAMKGPNP